MNPKKSARKRDGPVKIPLPFEEAGSDFLNVKPTAGMSRQGTHRAKPKRGKTE